jgi:hypothetical protein
MPAAPAGAVTNELCCRNLATRQRQCVDQPRGRDDCRAMLVVVEDRHIEQFAQLLLDDETFRRLDILEIDTAPAFAQELDAIDELIRVFGGDLEIDRIDIGKALEQDRFALHHRFRRQGPAIAKPENSGAIGDHRNEIALGGVVEGLGLVLGDGEHRHGHARRIGERKIALRRHRLGRHDFKLSGAALAVKQQRFLVGKGRALRSAAIFAAVFGRHFNSLLLCRQ